MTDENLDKIKARKESWEKETLANSVARLPEREKEFLTTSNIPVNRVYTPQDLRNFDYVRDLSFPGEYPYTRGVYPTMYRARFWTMRQYAGFGTAEQTNQRFRYLLRAGQTGLSVAFDFPTQISASFLKSIICSPFPANSDTPRFYL